MPFRSDNDLQVLTLFAWVLALPVLGFIAYLLWRKFGPRRRHRRHRSRMNRYLRE
jgi:cbb3-type cytochrome oxidase subunit 3